VRLKRATLRLSLPASSSRSHLEAGLALFDRISHWSLADKVGTHPHVTSQAYFGFVLFCLGFPDRALAESNAAIAEARRLAHPPSLAVSFSMGSRVLSLRGDNAPLDKWADQLVVVTTEQRAPAGTADFGHTKSGSQEPRRWRERDSNLRSRDAPDVSKTASCHLFLISRDGKVSAIQTPRPGQDAGIFRGTEGSVCGAASITAGG